ncbi:MAG: hypothetical protein HYV36_04815, partial [Lentisphaerae bacterium]|nr:hypothetical protein [Lentisphaerota bacterium]
MNRLKIVLGEPLTVAVSAPGERRWGHHQFPHIYSLEDGRLAVTYQIEADSAITKGLPMPLCVSADGGQTWQ